MAGFFTADDFFSFWLRPGLKKIKKIIRIFSQRTPVTPESKKSLPD
jgi:hypothetical protein